MSRNRFCLGPIAIVGGLLLVAGCATTPPGGLASAAPASPATWYTVAFQTNSFALDPYGQKVIDEVGDYLASNPGAIATVVGRTDTVGSDDYNMRLSHRRADAVRDSLVYNDRVAADRIETRWTGETRPHVNQADDIAAAANRVVDIAIH
jgi:outer membrane protein, adhesin transport system